MAVVKSYMKALLKQFVDLKEDNRNQRRDLRHLQCLVMKLTKAQLASGSCAACDDEEEETPEQKDSISYYIPCESYKNLQNLDRKLAEDKVFFDDAVCILVFC